MKTSLLELGQLDKYLEDVLDATDMETFIYLKWKTIFFSFTQNTQTVTGEEARTNSSHYDIEQLIWGHQVIKRCKKKNARKKPNCNSQSQKTRTWIPNIQNESHAQLMLAVCRMGPHYGQRHTRDLAGYGDVIS